MTPDEQALAAALCSCSQSYGRHALTCTTTRLRGNPLARRAFTDALAAHDRRVHRDTEPFCHSCGESLADADYTKVAGAFYCLTDCTGITRP